MKRGIIFSIDSMLAILLLVIIAALYAGIAETGDVQLHVAELKGNEAADAVVISYYSGGISDDISTSNNAECIEWYTYVINDSSEQSVPDKKQVCRGFQ